MKFGKWESEEYADWLERLSRELSSLAKQIRASYAEKPEKEVEKDNRIDGSLGRIERKLDRLLQSDGE